MRHRRLLRGLSLAALCCGARGGRWTTDNFRGFLRLRYGLGTSTKEPDDVWWWSEGTLRNPSTGDVYARVEGVELVRPIAESIDAGQSPARKRGDARSPAKSSKAIPAASVGSSGECNEADDAPPATSLVPGLEGTSESLRSLHEGASSPVAWSVVLSSKAFVYRDPTDSQVLQTFSPRAGVKPRYVAMLLAAGC